MEFGYKCNEIFVNTNNINNIAKLKKENKDNKEDDSMIHFVSLFYITKNNENFGENRHNIKK